MIENQQPAKALGSNDRTRRLILRPPELSDVPAITRIINDKVISRWASGVSYPYSAFEGRKFVNWAAARRRRLDGPGDLLITLRSNPHLVIGCIGLSGREGKYALGYWMNKAYRRRGYVNEAAKILVANAFADGAQSVAATFYEGNVISRRVMERLGMKRSGMTYGYSRFLKRKARLIIYRVTAAEWRAKFAAPAI